MFDYRYTDEAKGRESSSWHRVLETFVGRAGVFGPERGELLASQPPQSVPQAPPSTDGGSQRALDREPQADIDGVRFENEKLRRRIEELLGQREDDRRARQALEFQILRLTADLKALGVELATARDGNRAHQDQSPRAIGSDDQPILEGGERS